jgi:hypothetical protein
MVQYLPTHVQYVHYATKNSVRTSTVLRIVHDTTGLRTLYYTCTVVVLYDHCFFSVSASCLFEVEATVLTVNLQSGTEL